MWEIPQACTVFSPIELYARKPQGVLDLIKENCEEDPSTGKSVIQDTLDLRGKLMGWMSHENQLLTQRTSTAAVQQRSQAEQFTLGEKVLVLLKCQGPTGGGCLL